MFISYSSTVQVESCAKINSDQVITSSESCLSVPKGFSSSSEQFYFVTACLLLLVSTLFTYEDSREKREKRKPRCISAQPRLASAEHADSLSIQQNTVWSACRIFWNSYLDVTHMKLITAAVSSSVNVKHVHSTFDVSQAQESVKVWIICPSYKLSTF